MNETRLKEVIKEDFDTMLRMIEDIQENIDRHNHVEQINFYKPLKDMIFFAWEDSCKNRRNHLKVV